MFAVFLDRSIDVPAVVFTFALAIEIALSAVKIVRSEFVGVETTFAKSTLNPGTSFACPFSWVALSTSSCSCAWLVVANILSGKVSLWVYAYKKIPLESATVNRDNTRSPVINSGIHPLTVPFPAHNNI